MNARKAGLAMALMAASAVALALPTFQSEFDAYYKPRTGGVVKKATCTLCHIAKGPKLNPYGEDLKKAMGEAKVKKLTAGVLKKVDSLDSDKDGVANGAEIKADTLPGDPKSK